MDERVHLLNDQPHRPGGRYVLYWCRWNRRVEANYALLHAAETANGMGLPLVAYERLSCAYPSACDRFHTFVLEGVPHFERQLRKLGIPYIFQLPRRKMARDGCASGGDAAVVITTIACGCPVAARAAEAVESSCMCRCSRPSAATRRSIRPKSTGCCRAI